VTLSDGKFRIAASQTKMQKILLASPIFVTCTAHSKKNALREKLRVFATLRETVARKGAKTPSGNSSS